MVKLTRLNGSELYVNPALIELIEELPDTHITLTNGNRYIVLEPARIVVERIIAFNARALARATHRGIKRYLRPDAAAYRPYCQFPDERSLAK
jgi:flagellar protein FlbD